MTEAVPARVAEQAQALTDSRVLAIREAIQSDYTTQGASQAIAALNSLLDDMAEVERASVMEGERRIDAMEAELVAVRERETRLREALEQYADPDNWNEDAWGVQAVIDFEYGEAGQCARAALVVSSQQETEGVVVNLSPTNEAVVSALRLAQEGSANAEVFGELAEWLLNEAPLTNENDLEGPRLLLDGIRALGGGFALNQRTTA